MLYIWLFDVLAIFLEVLILKTPLESYIVNPTLPWAGLIYVFFLISLYLKRYDPSYKEGVEKLSKAYPSMTMFVTYVSGALTGALLGVIYLYAPVLDVVAGLTGTTKDVVFNHPITIVLTLPLIFLLLALLPGFLLFTRNKKFSLSSKYASVYSAISRVGIVIQAAVMLSILQKTFHASGSDITTQLFGVVFMTTLFYLPIKIHNYYSHSKGHFILNYTVLLIALLITSYAVQW